MEGGVDAFRLLHGELVLVHQLIDIEPVTLGGGDASGRGVRLFQIALLLQIRHVVADGCGGDVELGQVGHRLGADGLGGLDVAFDDGPEYFLFSLA